MSQPINVDMSMKNEFCSEHNSHRVKEFVRHWMETQSPMVYWLRIFDTLSKAGPFSPNPEVQSLFKVSTSTIKMNSWLDSCQWRWTC